MAFNKNMIIVILVGFSVVNANTENVTNDDKADLKNILGDWYVVAIIANNLDKSSVPQCWNVTIYPSSSGSSPSSIEGVSHYAIGTTGKRVDMSFNATLNGPTGGKNYFYYNVSGTKVFEDNSNEESFDLQILHVVRENGLAYWHMQEHETYRGSYSYNLIASRYPKISDGVFVLPTSHVNNTESSTCALFHSQPSTVQPTAQN